jgi:hypothetical protein
MGKKLENSYSYKANSTAKETRGMGVNLLDQCQREEMS